MTDGRLTNDRAEQDPNENLRLRKQLVASFHDVNVHAGFDDIFADIPPELRGIKPVGQPFSLWRLLVHLRLGVLDFLDCYRIPGYVEPPVPEGYWPVEDAPPSEAAWRENLAGFRRNMGELEAIILDPAVDLFSPISGDDGRTLLRQILACLDHNAYHLGQAILLRRLLGVWADQDLSHK